MAKKKTTFDATKDYDERISKLAVELMETCSVAKIPAFFSAAVKEENGQTEFKTIFVSPTQVDKELSEDRLANFAKVAKGYHVIDADQVVDEKDLDTA